MFLENCRIAVSRCPYPYPYRRIRAIELFRPPDFDGAGAASGAVIWRSCESLFCGDEMKKIGESLETWRLGEFGGVQTSSSVATNQESSESIDLL